MRSKIILSIAVAGALVFSSCKKEFLDEPKPTSSIPASDIYASEVGVRSFLSGVYRNLRTQWGTSTDAWGITSVNLAREVKGLDVIASSNWYAFDYQHDNREPSYRRTSFTWNFFYETVNQANNLIDGVTKSSLSQASKDAFLAEGRSIRAWAYFELVREFSHAYSENPNAPGVPIYTTPTTLETTGNLRGKVSDVYNLITSDLEYAVTKLPTSRPLKDVINKNVANGLLARVYLEMGKYNEAINAAQAARSGYSLSASNYSTPFNDIAKSEVIWGFPQSADQSIYYGSPSAFYGLSATPGYYNFYIDSAFVSKFSATDVRKSTFYSTGATSVYTRYKSNKFGTATNFTDHIIMMRVPEMYLIEAEARAELGMADAADVLLTVQKNRDPNAVRSSNTGADLVAEILLERRKELYGEIGIGYLDIKRKGLALVRSAGHPLAYRFNIPANSNKFTLKIPQTEMDANKSLTPADQNQ
jgi:starch-binding outer membrane protein, SusD/RagB family